MSVTSPLINILFLEEGRSLDGGLKPQQSILKKQKKLVTREERNKIIVLLLDYSTMYNSD